MARPPRITYEVSRRRVSAVVVSVSVLLSFAVAAAASVRIQVIDRGQADGILVRTPNYHWIVIDAGTNGQQADAMSDEWGVDKVELAVVSHRHFDHHGGMDNVINAIDTERFVGIFDDCPDRTSDDTVRNAVSSRGVTVESLTDLPRTIEIDDVVLTILPMPARSECPDHENNNSLVVRLDHGDFSMLFTGDAEVEELTWLVENHSDLLDVDVLKASHHGSNNGRTTDFLAAASPERVVISAGVNDTYRHPHANAVSDYLNVTDDRVYCTNRHGTIRVYGYLNGNVRIYRQFDNAKSCVYDGTHY